MNHLGGSPYHHFPFHSFTPSSFPLNPAMDGSEGAVACKLSQRAPVGARPTNDFWFIWTLKLCALRLNQTFTVFYNFINICTVFNQSDAILTLNRANFH